MISPRLHSFRVISVVLAASGLLFDVGRVVAAPELMGLPYYEPTLQNFQACVQNNDVVQVRRLLGQRPELATVRSPQGTVLHCAALSSALGAAEVLFEHGADVNAVDMQGRTPLLISCLYQADGVLPFVKLLVAHGADLNRADSSGDVPLHLALAAGNRDLAIYLAGQGARDETTPVFDALVRGDLAGLQAILKASPGAASQGIAEVPDRGRLLLSLKLTPLYAAVVLNRVPLVRALLEAGAYVKARNAKGETVLHLAARLDDVETIGLLLDAGADPNERREPVAGFGQWLEAGEMPLHVAAEAGAIGACKLLLEKGASVNAQTSPGSFNFRVKETLPGRTALDIASRSLNFPLVELLLAHGAAARGPQVDDAPLVSVFERSRLVRFVRREDPVALREIVRILLKAGANPNARDNWLLVSAERNDTVLAKAVASDAIELVTLLLDSGADINALTAGGQTPLMIALESNSSGKRNEMSRLLLQRGADVNLADSSGRTPLFGAVTRADVELVEELLERDAKAQIVDKKGLTPISISLNAKGVEGYDRITAILRAHGTGDAASSLFDAIASGDEKAVETVLVKDPKLLGARSPLGETPLAHAIRNGQVKVVSLLLARGADTEVTSNGATALFFAVDFGPPSMVRLLLKHGAKVNGRNRDGETPLFWAMYSVGNDMLRLLLRAGADAKAVDKHQRTLLHHCVDDSSIRDADVVKMDLLAGQKIDVNARDEGGQTALHLAAMYGKPNGVKWLLAHGAALGAKDNSGFTAMRWAEMKGKASVLGVLRAAGDQG